MKNSILVLIILIIPFYGRTNIKLINSNFHVKNKDSTRLEESINKIILNSKSFVLLYKKNKIPNEIRKKLLLTNYKIKLANPKRNFRNVDYINLSNFYLNNSKLIFYACSEEFKIVLFEHGGLVHERIAAIFNYDLKQAIFIVIDGYFDYSFLSFNEILIKRRFHLHPFMNN